VLREKKPYDAGREGVRDVVRKKDCGQHPTWLWYGGTHKAVYVLSSLPSSPETQANG
jgi:uncharacterized membrane protein YdcZ (DUF606 family)